MADVVLGVGKASQTYAYQILEALRVGFVAAVQLSQTLDSDAQDYADRLKEILIQSYTTILYAFNENEPFTPMTSTLPWLFDALQALCDPKLKPTVVRVLPYYFRNSFGPPSTACSTSPTHTRPYNPRTRARCCRVSS